MARIPTKKIKADTAQGFMVINADEFNPDEHELYEDQQNKAKAAVEPNNPPDFTGMSNKDLAAWGKAKLGLDLDGRMGKSELVSRIKRALDEGKRPPAGDERDN